MSQPLLGEDLASPSAMKELPWAAVTVALTSLSESPSHAAKMMGASSSVGWPFLYALAIMTASPTFMVATSGMERKASEGVYMGLPLPPISRPPTLLTMTYSMVPRPSFALGGGGEGGEGTGEGERGREEGGTGRGRRAGPGEAGLRLAARATAAAAGGVTVDRGAPRLGSPAAHAVAG